MTFITGSAASGASENMRFVFHAAEIPLVQEAGKPGADEATFMIYSGLSGSGDNPAIIVRRGGTLP
jgi:hypothetical protein